MKIRAPVLLHYGYAKKDSVFTIDSPMSEGQYLFLFLCCFYLADCVLWIGKQSAAFVSFWGKEWKTTLSSALFGNPKGGLLLVNPLPPLGRAFLCHISPVSIAPTGVCAYNLQSLHGASWPYQTGEYCRFDDIETAAADEKYLLINQQKFAKYATAGQASRTAKFINHIKQKDMETRGESIASFLNASFDKTEAANRIKQGFEESDPVRLYCNAMFVYLFVIVPILVALFGLLRFFITIAAVTVLFASLISYLYYASHKRLFPDRSGERIGNAIKMILCPPVAIRATDLLTVNLLDSYNPIVAASLLSLQNKHEFIASYLRDLHRPLRHDLVNDAAVETVTWFAERQFNICLKYLEGFQEMDVSVILKPPKPMMNGLSYCPRCHAQYEIREGECSDCTGVELAAFNYTDNDL